MLLSSDVHPQPEKSGVVGEEDGDLRSRPGRRSRPKKLKSCPAEEARKRRLSDAQVQFLEVNFVEERKLESGRKAHLAAEIGLEPKQVAVWFQNRRARWKAKRMEDEFSKLNAAHAAAVLHNSRLESEVLSLKEKILEAEEEIRKLSAERGRGDSVVERSNGGSPCSSSLETDQNILHDQINIEGGEGELLKCIPDCYYNDVYMMDWMNLYHDL